MVVRQRAMLKKWIALLSGFFLAVTGSGVLACVGPPAELYRKHVDLIEEAAFIVLVKAMSSDAPGGCALAPVRILKGVQPEALPVVCILPRAGDWMTSFSAHKDAAFWKERTGRAGVASDCSLLPPAFEIGRLYLIFGGRPDTKQFEQVDAEHDKWLDFVEGYLHSSALPGVLRVNQHDHGVPI